MQNTPTINNVCVPIESLRKKIILFSKGMHAVLGRHSVLRLQVAGTGLADQVQQQHLVCSSPLGHLLESPTFKSGLLFLVFLTDWASEVCFCRALNLMECEFSWSIKDLSCNYHRMNAVFQNPFSN